MNNWRENIERERARLAAVEAERQRKETQARSDQESRQQQEAREFIEQRAQILENLESLDAEELLETVSSESQFWQGRGRMRPIRHEVIETLRLARIIHVDAIAWSDATRMVSEDVYRGGGSDGGTIVGSRMVSQNYQQRSSSQRSDERYIDIGFAEGDRNGLRIVDNYPDREFYNLPRSSGSHSVSVSVQGREIRGTITNGSTDEQEPVTSKLVWNISGDQAVDSQLLSNIFETVLIMPYVLGQDPGVH